MTYFKASASKPCGEGYTNVTNSLEICSHLSGNWYMRGGMTNWCELKHTHDTKISSRFNTVI